MAEYDEIAAGLPQDWRIAPLGDLVEGKGISYGIVQPGNHTAQGVPIVRVKDLKNGRINTTDPMRVAPEVEGAYARTRLSGGEVLLSLVGSVGESAVVPECLAGWNVARAIAVLRANKSISARWLNLCLSTELVQRHIGMFLNTTVQATLNLKDVRRLPIVIPPAGDMEAITAVLTAVDDKIAINDRIARTCRELGQTIFASRVTQTKVAIQDICTIVMGQSPPGESYNEISDGLPFYQGTRDFGFHQPRRRVWSTAVTRHAAAGDVLVSVRAPVGQVNVASEKCGIGRGLAALSAHAYPHTLHHALMADAAAWAPFEGEGTVFSSINKQQLHALRIRWPKPGEEPHLEPNLRVIDQRLMGALAESESLDALRDTLLPELMSGRLRVRDAEKVVEEAV